MTDTAPLVAARDLAERLADLNAIIVGDDGAWSVSVDLGGRDTLDADYDPASPLPWQITARTWAPDHGMDSEREIAAATDAALAATVIRTVIAEDRAQTERMEAAMAAEPLPIT